MRLNLGKIFSSVVFLLASGSCKWLSCCLCFVCSILSTCRVYSTLCTWVCHTCLDLFLEVVPIGVLLWECGHCRLSLLEDVDGTGESGEIVAGLSVEERGMGQPPHVLRLDLRPREPRLDQNPDKQGEEVWKVQRGKGKLTFNMYVLEIVCMDKYPRRVVPA